MITWQMEVRLVYMEMVNVREYEVCLVFSSQVSRMLTSHDFWLCQPINFSGGRAL